jgi:hypothetical protein
VAICSAIKANGGRCTAVATDGSEYCYHHDPGRAAERSRNAAKGGKGKTARRTAALWDEVRGVIANVESGSLEPSQGNTMLRGYGTLISLARLDVEQRELEIQQRRLELDEEERLVLAQEMEELRELVEANKARRGYGA